MYIIKCFYMPRCVCKLLYIISKYCTSFLLEFKKHFVGLAGTILLLQLEQHLKMTYRSLKILYPISLGRRVDLSHCNKFGIYWQFTVRINVLLLLLLFYYLIIVISSMHKSHILYGMVHKLVKFKLFYV